MDDAKDESNKLVLREAPMEIINTSHIHPFKLKDNYVIPRYGFGYAFKCILCKTSSLKMYYCGVCDFHLCSPCVKKNPLSVEPRKTHEHPLTFLPKFSFVFTCDACGVGDRKSSICMCIPCCFTIHLECVSLPRVICINRHEHRISLRLPLGSSSTHQTCRLCRKDVNGEYGGYSCLTCPDYVVHSKCATDGYAWDGIELDGVPEEDPRDIMPFEVIDEGVIKHFGHEHNLRLTVLEEGDDDDDDNLHERSKQCFACILPIYSDPYYICTNDDCDFILHEVCANFLKKKRHPADRQRFTLYTFSDYASDFCECCERNITGFHYESDYTKIHVLCASFQDGYVHASHPHSELAVLDKRKSAVCSNCKRKKKFSDRYWTMRCTKCKDFSLCFRCLTLPKVVEHKYDRHPLSLCYGESSKSGYWCDICEKSLDPTKWYYTCQEGNSTLHTHCVLGEDLTYRIGSIHEVLGMEYKVVHNSNVTRPRCRICSSRCEGPILFKFKDVPFCSMECIKCKWACKVCKWYDHGEHVLYSCPKCKRSNVLGKG